MSDLDPSAENSLTQDIGNAAPAVDYVVVDDLRRDGDHDTCLRPLGLCELGGACDSCWYRPDHPRFQK